MPDPRGEDATRPPLVRAYERQGELRARGRRLAEAVVDGVFLGLMTRDDLGALDRSFYARATEAVDGRAHRYDEAGHIGSGLAPWEAEVVEAAFPAGSRIVVTSAGGGREVLALRRAGYDAVGFEPNARLVAAGAAVLAAEGHPGALSQSAPDRFPTDAPADGVIIGWGSLNLIQGAARRLALLQGARAVLEPGAPLLLSYFLRPPVRYFRVVETVGGPLRRLRGGEPLEHGDALSPNYVHYFSVAEVEGLLRGAGFAAERHGAVPYAHTLARAV